MDQQRRQRVMEQITADVTLTDNLSDAMAGRLIQWGTALANWQLVQATEMDDATADAYLETHMKALRKAIRRVNRLIGELPGAAHDEIAEALAMIFGPAAKLPGTASQLPTDLDALATRLKGMTPDAATEVILAVLTGEGASSQ
jgi:hypothetical protein